MRRGLSPLVATLLLIAFTVMGGIIVYEFYNRTSESIIASGEQLIVTAAKTQLNATKLLVQLDVVNGHRGDVKIKTIKALAGGGQTDVKIIAGETDASIPSGKKQSYVAIVQSNANAIIIDYEMDGRQLSRVVPLK